MLALKSQLFLRGLATWRGLVALCLALYVGSLSGCAHDVVLGDYADPGDGGTGGGAADDSGDDDDDEEPVPDHHGTDDDADDDLPSSSGGTHT